jgi:Lipopolysaccharide biosynthesis proteins, LPS:glycosyltransferases
MKKPVAVTIGIGDYLAYAQKSAELVRKHLGLETRIITEEHLGFALDLPTFAHKVWTLKYKIWDIFPDLDFIMYHDCDWRPVRDFDIMDFLTDPNDLYFCLDRNNDHTKGLEKKYGLKPNTYFNAGWFVANRKHKALFDHCYTNYHNYEVVWHDQCVSNQVMKGLVTLADKRLNVMDLYKDYHESEILAFHSSGNYPFYQGQTEPDWNTTVPERIMQWDDSEAWATARQHFIEIYETAKQYRRGKALEVGTFTGMGSMAMRLAGMQVKTIDVTYEFLPRCQHLWSAWHIDFHKMSGEDELKSAEKYDVIFHDSYHGNSVIPELVLFFMAKLNKGGKLIVHDVDALDLDLLLTELGNVYPKKKVKHTVTTDERGRQLGTFWV